MSEKAKKIIKDIFETLIYYLFFLGIVFIVFTFLFMPVRISQTSMYPTLKDGSFGFTNIIKKKIKGIERFDIVIIEDEKRLIKRVIGLPNETITYINDRLYVDGEYVEEDFLDSEYKSQYSTFTTSFQITLKDDEYFCLGDNRPVSADSRIYGPFKYDQILSVDALILYPFSDLGVY